MLVHQGVQPKRTYSMCQLNKRPFQTCLSLAGVPPEKEVPNDVRKHNVFYLNHHLIIAVHRAILR